MICNDPLVGTLRQFGYNLVRLPRASIEPLQVLSRDGGDLEIFGGLRDILNGEARLPVIRRDVTVPSLSGDVAKSGAVDLNVGLGFLGAVLSAAGVPNLGIDAAFNKASKVTFEFLDPRQDEVTLAELDDLLQRTEVRDSGLVKGLFGKGAIFVITATLRCRKFRVDAKTTTGQDVGIDASKIQPVAGGKVHLDHDAEKSSSLVYEGDPPLVFGFQAVQLKFGLLGRFQGLQRVSPGSAMLRDPEFVIDPAEEHAELSVMSKPDDSFLDLVEPTTDED
jgi:hypothetical protein